MQVARFEQGPLLMSRSRDAQGLSCGLAKAPSGTDGQRREAPGRPRRAKPLPPPHLSFLPPAAQLAVCLPRLGHRRRREAGRRMAEFGVFGTAMPTTTATGWERRVGGTRRRLASRRLPQGANMEHGAVVRRLFCFSPAALAAQRRRHQALLARIVILMLKQARGVEADLEVLPPTGPRACLHGMHVVPREGAQRPPSGRRGCSARSTSGSIASCSRQSGWNSGPRAPSSRRPRCISTRLGGRMALLSAMRRWVKVCASGPRHPGRGLEPLAIREESDDCGGRCRAQRRSYKGGAIRATVRGLDEGVPEGLPLGPATSRRGWKRCAAAQTASTPRLAVSTWSPSHGTRLLGATSPSADG